MGEVKSLRNRMGVVIGMMTVIVISAVIVVAAGNLVQDEAPEGPVFGRDVALRYLFESKPELSGLVNPSTIRTPWHEEILTPEGCVGEITVQYMKGKWTVTVSTPVVLKPVYYVEVEFTGNPTFTWEGTIDQDGNVADCDLPLSG
jgi:hypothetical protein